MQKKIRNYQFVHFSAIIVSILELNLANFDFSNAKTSKPSKLSGGSFSVRQLKGCVLKFSNNILTKFPGLKWTSQK